MRDVNARFDRHNVSQSQSRRTQNRDARGFMDLKTDAVSKRMTIELIISVLLYDAAGNRIQVLRLDSASRGLDRFPLRIEDDAIDLPCIRLQFAECERTGHIAVVAFEYAS